MMAKKFGDGSGDNYSPHTRHYTEGGGQHTATATATPTGNGNAGGACGGDARAYHTGQQQVHVVANNPSFTTATTTTTTTHMPCQPPPPPPYRHHHHQHQHQHRLPHTGADTTITHLTLPTNPFIAMNAMERSNTEPLLAEEDFSELLRDNSLLTRNGSGIFQQLIAESPQPLHIQMTQQDHQYAQQIPEVQLVQHITLEQQQQQIQQMQEQDSLFPPNLQLPSLSSSMWDTLGDVEELENGGLSVSLGPSSDMSMVTASHGITMTEGWNGLGPNRNSTPSIIAWPGRYAFQISIPTENRERNKWCYSSIKSKLYVCPKIAVPISVTVNEWFSDGSITITPVYQESQHMMKPVARCFNCKSLQMCDEAIEEHIVQVEGDNNYEFMGERHQVSVPLQPPQMGELASKILVKVMCLQTCNGGPNRRPFVLVFTLKNKSGEEIGRQVLDVKCCKCPSRDMKNDEEKHCPRNVHQAPRLDDEKRAKVRKLASEIVVGQQKKRPRIKLEPGTQAQFVNVATPIQFEKQVKSYINQLMAQEHTKRTNPQVMLYSEEEDSN